MEKETLKKAMEGDINAFQELFAVFQDQLRSYLFRLTANRSDAEDLTHDTFIRAFDKIKLFKGSSSLKTWVFQIATNLAYNYLEKHKRWKPNVAEVAKALVMKTPSLAQELTRVAHTSESGKYEIREHIDICFTCISKTLAIENQVVLLLKDVYNFSMKEMMIILEETEGKVKYLLQSARKTMTEIFNHRCALINKSGICHQCSELNTWFNPKQNQQAALVSIKMVKEANQHNKEKLYQMRAAMIKHIDPLNSNGHELQEALMNCNRMAMGELEIP